MRLGLACRPTAASMLSHDSHNALPSDPHPVACLRLHTHHTADALAAHSRHRSLSSATAVAGGHHHREVVSRNKHMDAAQGQPPAAGMPENGVDESGAAPPVGSGDSSAEVGRLQAEVSRLQAHIAELQARLAAEPQPAVGEEDAAPPPSAA